LSLAFQASVPTYFAINITTAVVPAQCLVRLG
jgi:hypothetical protein